MKKIVFLILITLVMSMPLYGCKLIFSKNQPEVVYASDDANFDEMNEESAEEIYKMIVGIKKEKKSN